MKGKCLCGKVEFEIKGKLPSLYQCHCSLCRKQGGSSSNSATIVPLDSLCWIQGEEQITRYRKASGFSSFFCPECGCPVPNQLRDSPYYWVPAGLLEDSSELKVVMHIYTGSKADWDEIPSNGEHFEEMPDLDTFNRILNHKQER